MKSLVVLAVVWASVANGQDAQSFIRNFPLLAALDTDHDGVISAAEIAASPGVLRSLDRDEDGKLSAEECAEGGERGPSSSDMVKMLMAFDKNGDGRLERSELPERMQELFNRGDVNHDGVLTADEIRALAKHEQSSRPKEADPDPAFRQRMERVIMRVIPALAALDADHNGEISEAEIENAPAALRKLDRNGDGKLTSDEVTPDWLRVFVAQGLAQFDTDGDGRISAEEASAPKAAPFRATLIAADRNHHGYATEEEIMAEVRLRADLNHDGVVTQEEIQQAMQSGALGKEEVRHQ